MTDDANEPAEASPLLRWVVRILFVVVFAAFIGALIMGARHPRFEQHPDRDQPTSETQPPS